MNYNQPKPPVARGDGPGRELKAEPLRLIDDATIKKHLYCKVIEGDLIALKFPSAPCNMQTGRQDRQHG